MFGSLQPLSFGLELGELVSELQADRVGHVPLALI
jgi:hypothetical protein